MRSEIKQGVEAIASHPKTAIAAAGAANLNTWWLNWGSPFIDAATSILGIVLMLVLIRYHWQNTKKVIRDNN